MWKNIRTDLAMEAREMAQEQGRHDIPGVQVENFKAEEDISITRVEVVSEIGEKNIGKPIGNYITLETPGIRDRDPVYEELVKKCLADEIRRLVNLNKDSVILVVGLGNWNVTADAVGPKVVDRVLVTRHIFEYVPDQVDERMRRICAVAPGVLGITGVETGEIVKGIVDKVQPDLVIAIDALASRKTERIGSTIQIADTGISPGSGIGNKRMGLNIDTLGVSTLAIGVPTVVYAHTIGRDALGMLIKEFSEQVEPDNELFLMLKTMDEKRLNSLVGEVLTEGLGDLVVTPKEVDLLIDDVADIIADGINLAIHDGLTLEEVNRYL
ncbi:MAG: GPR endopeptidase, partial [Clostridiales bacterium]|nr:GPR endopeptidase [Clostridiales bacterium]